MEEIFVARQPIFDRGLEVYGYEILFRQSALENFFAHPDPDEAAARTIQHSLGVFGLDTLGQDRRIFFNVTRAVLMHDLVRVLPRERTVIELLESVEADDEVVEACRSLKEAGYMLALDDFVAYPGCERLLELADIVKVDFLATTERQRRELPALLQRPGRILLAEKVETAEAFDEAMDLGYDLFQGYFFRRPEILAARRRPADEASHLRMLKAALRPSVSIDEVERVVRDDVQLAMRLLHLLNARANGWRSRAGELHEALELLDSDTLRMAACEAAITGLGTRRHHELTVSTLLRGKLCEELAMRCGLDDRAATLFVVGVATLLDAMVGRELPALLDELDASTEIREAILERRGVAGALLGLAIAYESGDWLHASARAANLGIEAGALPTIYWDGVAWAEQLARL